VITRVYLASPYPMRDVALEVRAWLRAHDVYVTSRWLDGPKPLDVENANMDLDDIMAAQALVLINPTRWANEGTGGRHTELGFALGNGMPVFILGEKSNVFHTLDTVFIHEDLTSLCAALNAYQINVARLTSSVWMLNQLISRVHIANKRWWHDLETGEPLQRNVGELLMLTVSELAEAMEGHRKSLPDDKLPHFPMFTVELADAMIRLCDIAGGMQLDVPQAFEEKMRYNAVREDHTDEHRKTANGKKY
jgi:NTP pyrophosphatase (non-canonical NTP hydrolase)